MLKRLVVHLAALGFNPDPILKWRKVVVFLLSISDCVQYRI